jgi:hypothetical protein
LSTSVRWKRFLGRSVVLKKTLGLTDTSPLVTLVVVVGAVLALALLLVIVPVSYV